MIAIIRPRSSRLIAATRAWAAAAAFTASSTVAKTPSPTGDRFAPARRRGARPAAGGDRSAAPGPDCRPRARLPRAREQPRDDFLRDLGDDAILIGHHGISTFAPSISIVSTMPTMTASVGLSLVVGVRRAELPCVKRTYVPEAGAHAVDGDHGAARLRQDAALGDVGLDRAAASSPGTSACFCVATTCR